MTEERTGGTQGIEGAEQQTSASRARVENDLRFLVRAAEVLSGTLDLKRTLSNVAHLLVEGFADWCIVYSADEEGRFVRESCAHRDTSMLQTLESFCAFPIDAAADGSVGAAVREQRVILIPEVPPGALTTAVANPERSCLLQKLNPISCVIAPLVQNGVSVGAVTCSRSTNPEPYGESDSALLRTVAIRMAMAVENARLFRRARRAEEILQDMSSGIEQVLYVSSIDPFRIEMVNPAFERMFGRRPEELYADPSSLIESIHPEDRGLVRAALGRQAEGESTETDYRILRPDGRLRWVRDRAFPRRAHDGKVYRVVGVVEDVTERKRREEELAFLADAGEVLSGSLNYVETLQNVASLAVPQIATWCAVDLLLPDGGLDRVAVAHIDPEKIRWARELQERYPVDMEAPQGVPQVLRSGQPELYSIIPEEMLVQAAVDEEHLQAILSAEIRSAMVAPLGIHGQVYGAISFVSDELGRYDEQSLELAVELARRAGQAVENARIHSSVEHMVEERTTELKALNRELEAFTYSVSHDLRAPLRAIVANARMLAEDFGEELPPQAHEFLKNQEDAAKRLALLIDELLQLSRLRKLEIVRSDFDFTALCHEVIREILSPEKAERVRIVVEDGRRANGDPRLVRIVIQNLLENAIKFSPEGGEIRVGSKAGAFFVQDQGIGFDMQFADKLFLPFERLVADHEFEGTGIGLASVQRVVQRHGGRVWAESTPGQGSTFFFTLE